MTSAGEEHARTVSLLLGGARMGRAIADALAARGGDLVLTYRTSRDAADDAAAAVRAHGRRAVVAPCEITDEASVASIVEIVDREFGRLDAVLQLASVYRAVPFERLTAAEWDAQLAVDLRGSFLIARACAPLLRRSGGGHLVFFSDWIAASGRPRYRDYLPYYVAKAGVKALTETLALELAPDVLVNAIAPGPIVAPPGTSDAASDAVVRATPLGRWGGVEAIVQTLLAVLDSSFVTGETIRVDGGRHVR